MRDVLSLNIPVVGAAKVVFGAGADNGRILLIAVKEELDFAFAPPVVIRHADRQISAYKLPASPDTIHNGVIGLVRQRIHPPELRMEIGGIVGNLGKGVVNLIGHCERIARPISRVIWQRPLKRHDPVAIHAAARIYHDRERRKLRVPIPALSKEIV